jgi:hypothetical protein
MKGCQETFYYIAETLDLLVIHSKVSKLPRPQEFSSYHNWHGCPNDYY